MIDGILRGLRNLAALARAAWSADPWDWAGLYRLMAAQLRRMAATSAASCHVGAARDARRMRVCAALLDRLVADDYLLAPPALHRRQCSRVTIGEGGRSFAVDFPVWEKTRHDFDRDDRRAKNDQRFVFDLLARHGKEWWS